MQTLIQAELLLQPRKDVFRTSVVAAGRYTIDAARTRTKTLARMLQRKLKLKATTQAMKANAGVESSVEDASGKGRSESHNQFLPPPRAV